MNKIFALLGKGSQGKTFSAIWLARALHEMGHEVTVVCLDSQDSLAYRVAGGEVTPNICDVLTGKVTACQARHKVEDSWYIVGGSFDFGQVCSDLDKKRGGFLAVREAVRTLPGIVLLDPVADLTGFSVESAIVAADEVIGVATPCADGVRLLDLIAGRVAEFQSPTMSIAPRFIGVIANRVMGVYRDGNMWRCRAGSKDDRKVTERLTNRSDLLGYVPNRSGEDKRDLKVAYQAIARHLVSE